MWDNLGPQILGGLCVLTIGGAVASFLSRIRKVRAVKTENEVSVKDELQKQSILLQRMHTVLVGDLPTDLTPDPPPGLVAIVPDLLKRTRRIEETLFTNGGRKNTVIDRLDRIEKAQPEGQNVLR